MGLEWRLEFGREPFYLSDRATGLDDGDPLQYTRDVRFTQYFAQVRKRPDREAIRDEWIVRAVERPDSESVQADGRIRRWARIAEANGKYLRVVLLADGETVHNAFFDRRFREPK